MYIILFCKQIKSNIHQQKVYRLKINNYGRLAVEVAVALFFCGSHTCPSQFVEIPLDIDPSWILSRHFSTVRIKV